MKYIFDTEVLLEVGRMNRDLPLPQKLEAITEELDKRYPGKICHTQEWILNNAGGAMGMFTILYASLMEYVIIFGSPVGNTGHTGNYSFVEDTSVVLEGEWWYFSEGQFERDVYRPGDQIVHPKGTSKCYRIVKNGWILEYARGPIPTMLPFGLGNSLFSTLDYKTIFRTFFIYGKHILRSL